MMWNFTNIFQTIFAFLTFVSASRLPLTQTQDDRSLRSVQFKKFISGTLDQVNYTVVLDPKLHFAEAQTACSQAELVLAGFNTVEQYNFAKDLAASAGLGSGYYDSVIYVGGYKDLDNEYRWLEGGEAVPSFFWNVGEPNNQHAEESCTTIWRYYVLQGQNGGNDIPCDEPWPFICKTLDEGSSPKTI